MKTILVANQKGGVGKTTIADELAFALERRGFSVAYSNLDNQGGNVHALTIAEDVDDFQVVDTPGNLTTDFQNWCRHADLVLLPCEPSMMGLPPLLRCYQMASEVGVKVAAVVNFYDKRGILDKQFVDHLKAAGLPVLGVIPRSASIKQAQALRQSVGVYKGSGKACAAIEDLTDQVIKELQNA